MLGVYSLLVRSVLMMFYINYVLHVLWVQLLLFQTPFYF
jgi:hypothetical protein